MPRVSSELERRFMGPILKRLFEGYPDLAYADALHAARFLRTSRSTNSSCRRGKWLNSPRQQQNYISANYTHALRYVLQTNVNVVGQLVAPSQARDRFSLSCNPDISVDLLEARQEGRADFIFAGETNAELPYMGGPMEVGASAFDLLLDSAKLQFPLSRRPASL